MRRLILMACAGALAAAMVSPSLAADLPRPGPSYKAPIYVAPFSWSGFYVGINGGYGWDKSTWSSPAIGTADIKAKGWLAGVTAGYNLQTGVFVFGLEGDFDYAAIKGSTNTGIGICDGATGCETKNTWLATGRGRIGYAWDRFLPFITGGAAYGGIKMTPRPGTTSETKSRLGWTFGGGVEYAFMGAWTAKVEYLYVDLGKAVCSAATCGVDTDVTYKTNLVRVGFNSRF